AARPPAAAGAHAAQVQRDAAAPVHRIHGVFADVLHHPVKQRHVEAGGRIERQLGFDGKLHLARHPAFEVGDGIARGVVQVFGLEHRHRADVAEALRNDFQALNILAQFLHNGLVVKALRLAQVHTGAAAGNAAAPPAHRHQAAWQYPQLYFLPGFGAAARPAHLSLGATRRHRLLGHDGLPKL
nr:hypothetical protein [Tanacetum cinerariifolium]